MFCSIFRLLCIQNGTASFKKRGAAFDLFKILKCLPCRAVLLCQPRKHRVVQQHSGNNISVGDCLPAVDHTHTIVGQCQLFQGLHILIVQIDGDLLQARCLLIFCPVCNGNIAAADGVQLVFCTPHRRAFAACSWISSDVRVPSRVPRQSASLCSTARTARCSRMTIRCFILWIPVFLFAWIFVVCCFRGSGLFHSINQCFQLLRCRNSSCIWSDIALRSSAV